jgi:hypothetical protein
MEDSEKYVKFRFRHLKDENNKLLATLCSFVDDNNKIVSIGLAICSKKDNFNRKIGSMISFGRAMKSYDQKENLYPITPRDCESIANYVSKFNITHKSMYFNKDKDYREFITNIYKNK